MIDVYLLLLIDIKFNIMYSMYSFQIIITYRNLQLFVVTQQENKCLGNFRLGYFYLNIKISI